MSEWRLAETAPKDGTVFQAWASHPRLAETVENCWLPFCKSDGAGRFYVLFLDEGQWHLLPPDRVTAWKPHPRAPMFNQREKQ